MARRGTAASQEARDRRVESAPLEPVGTVIRELTHPSGEVVRVEVPVYPPFRLKSDAEREAASG
ncbi:MAG: hypothetical protein ACQGVC_23285 [Myxococcota bacterium]